MKNFVAIGNDELGSAVKKGDKVVNHKMGLEGTMEYGTDESGKESNKLGFITTEYGNSYLVALDGKLVFEWEHEHETRI